MQEQNWCYDLRKNGVSRIWTTSKDVVFGKWENGHFWPEKTRETALDTIFRHDISRLDCWGLLDSAFSVKTKTNGNRNSREKLSVGTWLLQTQLDGDTLLWHAQWQWSDIETRHSLKIRSEILRWSRRLNFKFSSVHEDRNTLSKDSVFKLRADDRVVLSKHFANLKLNLKV